MKELTELRGELDLLDRELVAMLEKRMEIARGVAEYKLAHGLPVLDASREAQVIATRQAMLKEKRYAEGIRRIFEAIMAMSREEQARYLREAGEAEKHE